jgi:hypothetical protein
VDRVRGFTDGKLGGSGARYVSRLLVEKRLALPPSVRCQWRKWGSPREICEMLPELLPRTLRLLATWLRNYI